MGYIFTYIEIIKDAKSKGYENILILEDDVVLCHDFLRRMASFVEAIPSGWKVVNLGSSQYGWGKIDYFDSLSKGYYFPRIEDTKGSFAIGFNSSVFDELIFYQEKFEAAFDNLPLGVLYENHLGRCFNAFPYLVMPDVSASTIRGGRDQYSHANRMNWWVGDFDYPQKRLLVGIIITSNTNLSLYLDSKKDFLEYCDVVFYMKGENGILPVHNLSQCSEGDFLPFLEDDLDDVSVSVDVLIKVKPECVLSDSMLLGAVESFYSGTELPDGLDVIKSGSDDVVKGRVSVVVPTYKRPHNLRAALASVLDQDYGDIELLVVDDNGEGSDFSSATKEIVALLQSQYPHRTIKYLAHKVNANGAAARNTGIFRSSGEYIAFLDDDDIYLPGRVSQAVDFLRYTNNDCGAVYCGFLGWNSKELDLGRFAEGDLTLNILLLDYHSHYFHTNTVTYKRSSVFRINGFDSSYKRHQDLEFGLRFFEHYKVGVVKECLVRLSPEKSEVDNKVYGDEFVALKNKFLTEFAALIDKQDASVRDDIYSAHRGEVVKYAGSLDGVCF